MFIYFIIYLESKVPKIPIMITSTSFKGGEISHFECSGGT